MVDVHDRCKHDESRIILKLATTCLALQILSEHNRSTVEYFTDMVKQKKGNCSFTGVLTKIRQSFRCFWCYLSPVYMAQINLGSDRVSLFTRHEAGFAVFPRDPTHIC